MTAVSLEAPCPRHPENAAEELCIRCGSFACSACIVDRQGDRYCVDCARRLPPLGGSWYSIIAGILSFLSLGCAPLGLVAIVLAGIDLTMISAGRKWGRQGVSLDLLAIGLSLVGILLGALILYRAMNGQIGEV
ncbi:hypothetical protein [Hyalangium gracile]|uniref:hypothetical protein n=1 Tax=Hyalangium gracile TaxID=394092 RepID=UPI001CD01411|nr:hypothetical protein [Hyalangium gracile]